jgi:hypothetical protein
VVLPRGCSSRMVSPFRPLIVIGAEFARKEAAFLRFLRSLLRG